MGGFFGSMTAISDGVREQSREKRLPTKTAVARKLCTLHFTLAGSRSGRVSCTGLQRTYESNNFRSPPSYWRASGEVSLPLPPGSEGLVRNRRRMDSLLHHIGMPLLDKSQIIFVPLWVTKALESGPHSHFNELAFKILIQLKTT